MSNETWLLQQIDLQNDIIKLLQKENACFRQIIQSYLLSNVAASDSEMALVKLLVEKNLADTSFANTIEGANGSNNSLANHTEGIERKYSFLRDNGEGISGKNSFQQSNKKGISGKYSFLRDSNEGNYIEYIAKVAARLRPFMKYAMQLSLENTALILCHLHSDPTTPLPQLRKLTDLSEDGMAKRIMALKKAGLIVRFSKPLRYVLTEKAIALLMV